MEREDDVPYKSIITDSSSIGNYLPIEDGDIDTPDTENENNIASLGELVIGGGNFVSKVVKPWLLKTTFTPEELWKKFEEYCQWMKNNPLYAAKWEKGTLLAEPRMRAMTELGFCLFAGISKEVFLRYKKGIVGVDTHGDRLQTVSNQIANCIYLQKFEGASADMLNANIISRDLGLVDKKRIDVNPELGNAEIEFE